MEQERTQKNNKNNKKRVNKKATKRKDRKALKIDFINNQRHFLLLDESLFLCLINNIFIKFIITQIKWIVIPSRLVLTSQIFSLNLNMLISKEK